MWITSFSQNTLVCSDFIPPCLHIKSWSHVLQSHSIAFQTSTPLIFCLHACTNVHNSNQPWGCLHLTLWSAVPGGTSGKEHVCPCMRPEPWLGKTPWRSPQQPTPVYLPGESSPWVCKVLDMTEWLSTQWTVTNPSYFSCFDKPMFLIMWA